MKFTAYELLSYNNKKYIPYFAILWLHDCMIACFPAVAGGCRGMLATIGTFGQFQVGAGKGRFFPVKKLDFLEQNFTLCKVQYKRKDLTSF